MTILEPNQSWPQIEVPVFNRSLGIFGGYEYKIVDTPITTLVGESISRFAYKRGDTPITLFAGPRARNKIADLIAQSEALRMITVNKFFNGVLDDQKKFLGLDLVFTIDDGLWMA